MALEFVDIREVWDVIRPGLELIQSETNPDWRIEDVYASCVNQHSFLLMDTARTATGFTVVETKSHPFRDKTIMLVWIAYDPVPNSVPTYQSQLEALALQTGHSEIQVDDTSSGSLGHGSKSRIPASMGEFDEED